MHRNPPIYEGTAAKNSHECSGEFKQTFVTEDSTGQEIGPNSALSPFQTLGLCINYIQLKFILVYLLQSSRMFYNNLIFK